MTNKILALSPASIGLASIVLTSILTAMPVVSFAAAPMTEITPMRVAQNTATAPAPSKAKPAAATVKLATPNFSNTAKTTAGTATGTQALNRIVAVVNNGMITQEDLGNAILMARQQLTQSNTPIPSDSVLRKQVLNQLITQKILTQMVKQYNINITSSQVNDAIANIATKNKLTVLQLKQQLEQSGGNYAKYRDTIKQQIAISQLQQQAVSSQIKVSNEAAKMALQNYIKNNQTNKEYNVGDILISVPDAPTPAQIQAAKSKANMIVNHLKSGANFKKMAATYSSGQNALKGGSLGWSKPEALPTLFANAIQGQKAGSVFGPLKAGNGFHILKILAVRNAGKQPTLDQMKQMLMQRKFQTAIANWIAQQKSQAYIKIIPAAK